MTPRSRIALLLAALLLPSILAAQTSNPIPYTLNFVAVNSASGLPALQSYCLANVAANQWLILGGRTVGLHTFNPAGNFTQPNTILWSIDPTQGTATQIADLSQIAPSFGDPLTATNQECEYNPQTGYWTIVGGYGLSHASNTYITFPSIIQIPVAQVVAIANSSTTPAQKQAAIAALLQNSANALTNSAMKVTGGVLSHSPGGLEFLSFGQVFDGQYNPFGGGFTQLYTQSVLPFTISENPFAVRTLSPITSTSPNAPYNRRDFAAAYDVDPATKLDRFAVFGGVFKPGAIAGYDYPVYITTAGINVAVNPDQTVTQHFGFYQSPVIVAWDGSNIYHTFFGGIGHYFMTQTQPQAQVYQYVTQQGRNDGLPFVEDIDTLIENSSGKYQEYVAPQTVPGNMLHGAAIDFIPNLGESAKFQGTAGSVVNLSTFTTGEQELIGYIYGGIEAAYPLPCKTSTGTTATNALYQVYLTLTPWSGLVSATKATEAVGYYTHGDPSVKIHGPASPGAPKPAAPPVAPAPNPCTASPPLVGAQPNRNAVGQSNGTHP